MIVNYDQSVEINHNPDCLYISDHPYRILITDVSGWGKANVLLSLIKHKQPDIEKIYLYVHSNQSINRLLREENL